MRAQQWVGGSAPIRIALGPAAGCLTPMFPSRNLPPWLAAGRPTPARRPTSAPQLQPSLHCPQQPVREAPGINCLEMDEQLAPPSVTARPRTHLHCQSNLVSLQSRAQHCQKRSDARWRWRHDCARCATIRKRNQPHLRRPELSEQANRTEIGTQSFDAAANLGARARTGDQPLEGVAGQ